VQVSVVGLLSLGLKEDEGRAAARKGLDLVGAAGVALAVAAPELTPGAPEVTSDRWLGTWGTRAVVVLVAKTEAS